MNSLPWLVLAALAAPVVIGRVTRTPLGVPHPPFVGAIDPHADPLLIVSVCCFTSAVLWAPRLLTSKPDWLKEPAASDVLPQLHWVPVLTFFQVSADMMNSTGVPKGHGHNYGTNQAWGWAAVAKPPGWTDAKTEELVTKLSAAGD